MTDLQNIKENFLRQKESIFTNSENLRDAYKFCVRYSLLVEEYIYKIASADKLHSALVSGGSFSRRELSPLSDIDLIFIAPEIEGRDDEISRCVAKLWDAGIEVSHTFRTFTDIKKFLESDLHAFTQFFETRFLLGDEGTYNEWNALLFNTLDAGDKDKLLMDFIDDINTRHSKYGKSPKMLEPNIKYTCGGLRDLHAIEWMYSIKNGVLLTEQSEITQTQSILNLLRKEDLINRYTKNNLLESYAFLLNIRNHLHLTGERKNDRLEFRAQERIAKEFDLGANGWHDMMRKYFESANIINRFSKSMVKKFHEELALPISDILSIKLDDDFSIKGNVIALNRNSELTISEIFRAFYYRGFYNARFTQELRWKIIESIQEIEEEGGYEQMSSVFFREILRLPKNVGKTLSTMNELGVLGAFMPEFKELLGFFQPGVYHCYTADEHTLIALHNLENLGLGTSDISKIFNSLKNKDILYLAVLFHDIAKPINVSGHEIIGAEIANSIMERLNYDPEEISVVQFLVRHHLTMEQIAFRRNLNDPSTLNNFASIFPSSKELDMLYLLTYADLSAVSPAVWTHWKNDLLNELHRKIKRILDDNINAEELLNASTAEILLQSNFENENVQDHIESINDLGYVQHFTEDEINLHIEEIERGSKIGAFFKEASGFTNITIVTKDSNSLLSRLCGALAINDLNIHSAQIFTRKDGIVIDSFSVTDFRTHKPIEPSRYIKIENDLHETIEEDLQIIKEFNRVKSKWWRIENKFFKRKGKIKIQFESHEKYTIIDVFSPDRLGLLYQITKKMNELGLVIHLAKISTKGDDVVDAFYILDRNGKKISHNDYELIRVELTLVIESML
jgi:[protein-PII] uridylyltransferase